MAIISHPVSYTHLDVYKRQALVLSAMILSFTACSPDIKDDTVLSSSSSALDVDDMSADAAYQEAEPEILKVLNLIGAEDEPIVLSSTLEDEISRIYLCVDCIVDGKPLFIIASTLKYADQTDWSVNSVSKVEEEGLRHYYSIIASDRDVYNRQVYSSRPMPHFVAARLNASDASPFF